MKKMIDCATNKEIIGNRFSNISLWHYLGTTPDERLFHEWAEKMPLNWLKDNYPWIEEIQLFIATGGSYLGHRRSSGDSDISEFNRDLFKDPSDRSVTDDYDFTPLVRACRNILNQGVKPLIKLHGVPIKYSSEPQIDWFRVNIRPPDDYQVFADYITALITALIEAFGDEEVLKWRWFIGTEMENGTWWKAYDGTGDSSRDEFCKLYDWTLFAMEKVLGVGTFEVGSHAMMTGESTGGIWDPADFISHCEEGTNYATGKKGSRMTMFAISYYDKCPTELEGISSNLSPSADLSLFEAQVARTRNVLDKRGFLDVPIEVSEGGFCFGSDGKWLWHGLSVGGMFDASWTALSFFKMLQSEVSLWSRWSYLRTSGLFHGLENASTHALRMISSMQDDNLIQLTEEGKELSFLCSYHQEQKIIRVLLVHHAPDMEKRGTDMEYNLTLKNTPFTKEVDIEEINLKELEGDFWPLWIEDKTHFGLEKDDFIYSEDQSDVLHALKITAHKELWKTLSEKYILSSQFPEATVRREEIKGGSISLKGSLPCFSLKLLQIRQTKEITHER